jgi:hypothetical protein
LLERTGTRSRVARPVEVDLYGEHERWAGRRAIPVPSGKVGECLGLPGRVADAADDCDRVIVVAGAAMILTRATCCA